MKLSKRKRSFVCLVFVCVFELCVREREKERERARERETKKEEHKKKQNQKVREKERKEIECLELYDERKKVRINKKKIDRQLFSVCMFVIGTCVHVRVTVPAYVHVYVCV